MMIQELREKQVRNIRNKRRKRRIFSLLILLAVSAGLAAVYLWLQGENGSIGIKTYHIGTDKVDGAYRIVLMSDLHNSEFGDHNADLVQAVKEQEPDMILMCGDMVNKDDPDVSVVTELCGQLTETADIYYILGNHEGVLMYEEGGYKVPLDAYLTELGVTVCYNGEYTIENGDTPLHLFAVSMEEESYEAKPDLQKAFELFTEEEGFKIVASHYPAILYGTLRGKEYDLAVAGHYHGGLVNIPGKGGLYHTDTGFFPEYYGGIYRLDHAQLIVTRGLGNSSFIPRINNQPELVLIDINS